MPALVAGTLMLNHYATILDEQEGVVRVNLPSGQVSRFLAGRDGVSHPTSNQTIFLQGCGSLVSRVAVVDAQGLNLRVLTPCSSEVDNPGHSDTNFHSPALSPDGKHVAATATYYDADGSVKAWVIVFDENGMAERRLPGWTPAWAPDGRLLYGRSDGLFILEPDADEPAQIGKDRLIGEVIDPNVHPEGDRVAFAFQQRIWEIHLDGTGLQELAYGPHQMSAPAYSPDGRAIAFIGMARNTEAYILFKTLEPGHYFELDVQDQFVYGGVPRGPLSWTPRL